MDRTTYRTEVMWVHDNSFAPTFSRSQFHKKITHCSVVKSVLSRCKELRFAIYEASDTGWSIHFVSWTCWTWKQANSNVRFTCMDVFNCITRDWDARTGKEAVFVLKSKCPSVLNTSQLIMSVMSNLIELNRCMKFIAEWNAGDLAYILIIDNIFQK